MGGGNALKKKMARDKAGSDSGQKKHSAEDRKKMEASKQVHQCNICMTGFPRTVKSVELQTHLDNKHAKAKKEIADAFPTFVGTEPCSPA